MARAAKNTIEQKPPPLDSAVGITDSESECPESLQDVMRANSAALQELKTVASGDADLTWLWRSDVARNCGFEFDGASGQHFGCQICISFDGPPIQQNIVDPLQAAVEKELATPLRLVPQRVREQSAEGQQASRLAQQYRDLVASAGREQQAIDQAKAAYRDQVAAGKVAEAQKSQEEISSHSATMAGQKQMALDLRQTALDALKAEWMKVRTESANTRAQILAKLLQEESALRLSILQSIVVAVIRMGQISAMLATSVAAESRRPMTIPDQMLAAQLDNGIG